MSTLAAASLVGAMLLVPATVAWSSVVWTAPTDLSTPALDPSETPQVLVSDGGTRQIAAWYTYVDGTSPCLVQVAGSADNGLHWGPPVTASDPSRCGWAPSLVGSPDLTRVALAWLDSDPTGAEYTTVRVAVSSDSGATWSAPVDLWPGASTNARAVRIAGSADGQHLVVTWHSSSSPTVLATHSADGGTSWSSPQALGSGQGAQLVVSSDGRFAAVVWSEVGGVVLARSSDDFGASWASQTAVSGSPAGSPQVAASADGSWLLTVWQRYDGTTNVIEASRSGDQGAHWSSVATLSVPGRQALNARVAAATDGRRATVVWSRSDGVNDRVQTRSTDDGGASWNAVTDLSGAGGDAGGQRVGVSADGQLVTAVWRRHDGTSLVVQAAQSTDGGSTWTTAVDVSLAGATADGPNTAVAMNGSGATAVWHRVSSTAPVAQVSTTTTVTPAPTPAVTPTPTPTSTPAAPAVPVTTVIKGWPKKAVARGGRVTLRVRVTPAEGRQGIVQKRVCHRSDRAKCVWKRSARITWPDSYSAVRRVRLRASVGARVMYRLRLAATPTATALTTRALTVRGR